MAPGTLSPSLPSAAPYALANDGSRPMVTSSRNISAALSQYHNYDDLHHGPDSVEARQRGLSQRVASRQSSVTNVSNISNIVYSIKRRSSEELGSDVSAQLFNATHESLLGWISAQRMSDLPAEGSSYDKVLAWAQLFADRLQSFDHAIQEFAGDSYLAAQLAYGYCSLLLELGKENANALMIAFGLFYNMSIPLVNLLQRTELFSLSHEIREQLVLALSDLISLVASVATHFRKAIGATTTSVFVDVYATFTVQIKAFWERCGKTSDLMWQQQLSKEGVIEDRGALIKAIKTWITPEDQVLSSLTNSTSQLAYDRQELTCLYIGTYLTRFLRSSQQAMCLSGPPGSGKTVLASVMIDYLQHPIAGVTYSTVFVPITTSVPGECTPRAVSKSILSQLFQKRTGNVQLLNILIESFERSLKMTVDEDYDNVLWHAVERAVTAQLPGGKDLVLVIDGLDECSACEDAIVKRLQGIVSTKGASTFKLIILGSKQQHGMQNLVINEDLVFDDIMTVVRHDLKASALYLSMTDMERESLVARIATASKGSFIWAKQTTKHLCNEATTKDLVSGLEKAEKQSIVELVHKTLMDPESTENTRLLLTWLVTAERPLSIKELAALSSIDPLKQTIRQEPKLEEYLLNALKPINSLLYMQDGLLYLRHAVIRKCVIDFLNDTKGTVKDRHGDLCIRLLTYINTTVTESRELTMQPLDSHIVHHLTTKLPLLEFAVSYWPLHLRKSLAYLKPNSGDAEPAKFVSKILPRNLTVYQLQAAIWGGKPLPTQLKFYTTTTNVTRQLLTSKSPVTLQCLIFLATIYRQIDFTPDATTLYYEALTASDILLTSKSPITMQLAQTFIDLTSTRATASKSDVIMTQREQVLLLLTECYTAHYGQTSEFVVTTMKLLVEHYRAIKEDTKAQQITTTIRSISGTTELGESGTTATTGVKTVVTQGDIRGNLHVQLRGRKDTGRNGIVLALDTEEHDEVVEGHGAKYDFEFFMAKAERLLAENRNELAEKTYVEIWQRVTHVYRSSPSALWEQRRIRSMLCYARFLMQHKRTEGARSLLSVAWEEHRLSRAANSQGTIASDTTAKLHLEMATMMKSVGMACESLALMKYCAQYYQHTNKASSTMYNELQHTIESTSREIMKSASSSATVTVSETMLEEMVLEQSRSATTVDQSTFSATHRLVRLYITQHRWHDSIRLLKQILKNVWPSLFVPSVQDVVAPTSKYATDCVDLAERLADCYHARRRRSQEEDIRIRIYRAIRPSRKIDDKLRERVTNELIQLLRQSDEQTELLIKTRQEMLDDYTSHYGNDHPIVLRTLRDLAELTRPRPIFIKYYQRIIELVQPSSVKGQETIIESPELFEPYMIVATELYNKGQFSDAVPYYKAVLTTFFRQPKTSPKLADPSFIKPVFDHYIFCLRSVPSGPSVIHGVATEYQAQCKTVFGSNTDATIQATLYLANMCQESKRYETQAVALYEDLLKIKDSRFFDHAEISAILDSIYEERAELTARSGVSHQQQQQSMSSEQSQRAMKTLRQRVVSTREMHGWAHEESLAKLSDMIRFASTQNTSSAEEDQGRKQTILSELKQATVQILNQETKTDSSGRLLAAASTIASGYVQAQQVQQAIELKAELYRQIVMKDRTKAAGFDFDLTSRGRESLVFLAQFEHTLAQRHHSVTVTDILAELTTQYVYFAEFRSLVRSSGSSSSSSIKSSATSASLSTVLASASQLHTFLLSCEKVDAANAVFRELAAYFVQRGNKEGEAIQMASPSQVNIFLHNLLAYFSTFRSQSFVRSVAISGTRGVEDLLKQRKYEEAVDLTSATFTYISAQDEYRTNPAVAKMVLVLGLTLAESSGSRYSDILSSSLLTSNSLTATTGAAQKETSRKSSISKPNPSPKPGAAALAIRAKLLAASKPMTSSALTVLSAMNIDISRIPLPHLDHLIATLGLQRDYASLSRLLTVLWESRDDESQRAWGPGVMAALGRRFIMARYLVGDITAAVRLAEDIVYNCRRVHGSRHPRTLEMSVFLTQLYTAIAQKFNQQQQGSNKDGKTGGGAIGGAGSAAMAARYYKKSAAVHENILRMFSDPAYADAEAGMDESLIHFDDARSIVSGMSGMSGGHGSSPRHHRFVGMDNALGGSSTFGAHKGSAVDSGPSEGDRAKMHFRLLKLAVERLGAWPKDYSEYERLNADVFREFGDSLDGVEGVEKWNLRAFGSGKAEGSEDMIDIEGFEHWGLLGDAGRAEQEDEEL